MSAPPAPSGRRSAVAKRDATVEPDPGLRPASRIRAMTEGDVEAVMVIERSAFPSPWSEVTISNLLKRKNARLFVAVDAADRVLGYAAVWFAGSNGELGSLAVDALRRESGVGSQLLASVFAEARARGTRSMYLEVREGNWRAQRLYQRRGFEAIGRRKSYYKDPVEDAVVMRRLLAR